MRTKKCDLAFKIKQHLAVNIKKQVNMKKYNNTLMIGQ